MTKLFITADQVKQTTSISGSTDNSLLSQKIYYAQITDIVRILGQSLYDKIYSDLENDIPLTGDYLILFEKYVIDLHVFFTAFYFTIFNETKQSNVGNVVQSGTNFVRADNSLELAEQYKSLAVSVETNFRKFMENSTVPEWVSNEFKDDVTNFNQFY